MRVIGLISKNSGPSFHRILVPLLLMQDTDVYVTNAVEEKDFEKGCDAIYYNRLISDDVLALQKKYQFKIVVDVDDYWKLDPHHIMFRYSKENRVDEHQVKHLKIADVVTTTHERLAEMIYPINKNVVIVPNAIPSRPVVMPGADKELFPVIKTQSAKGHRRIFWQGSVTHEADIGILRKTIQRLDRDKFMMVMAGYTEQVEWERMADCFTNYQQMPGVVLPGTSPYEYYRNYQYADVAVVPLLSTKFNGYKSNLKVLEAAHSGVPVIASNVHPYKNMPVLYADKKEDWYKWLNDFEAQEESGKVLAEWVKEHYNFEKINQKRKEAFL